MQERQQREAKLGYYAHRLRYYIAGWRRSVHFKYWLANAVAKLSPPFSAGVLRARLYRLIGFDIGEHTDIMGNLCLTGASPGFYDKLVIGPDVLISDTVTINIDERVSIEAGAGLGPRVVIYTATHRTGASGKRLGDGEALPVTIEAGAWVRVGALILPGVTVGRGSIVGAGAVVVRDVPPNTLVVGNPAAVVRELT